MGHRISKVYTRTGDRGETGLADGSRLPKEHPRIDAMGDVDELNSHLGALRALAPPRELDAALERAQQDLFELGAEIALPGQSRLDGKQVRAVEQALDQLNAQLPPLKEFILPGGGRAGAQAFVARAVCRRAERSLWRLHRDTPVSETALAYVNRLSDLLFVIARHLARAGHEEISWQPRQPDPD